MSDEDSKEQLANLADFVKYADSMDIDRRNRWVRASVKLKIFDTWATVTTQCLGNLDSKLVKDDQKLCRYRIGR
jgi:hypothetical protein